MGASQHHPIVMRFMAIPINQNNIARFDQRLNDDFIGSRGSIGHEIGPVSTKGTSRKLLGFLDWTVRL